MILNLILALAIPAHCASAQTHEGGEALLNRVKKHDCKAILELGNTGDKSTIPLLREIKRKRNKAFGGASANAQMALAKLGEPVEFDEIVTETENPDPWIQLHAFRKLEYIGDKRATIALGRILSSEAPGHKLGGGSKGKVFYPPPANAAAKALSRILGDGPTKRSDSISMDELKQWRDWWKENGKKYQ